MTEHDVLEQISVCKSDDGRISVFDQRDNFMASFVDGRWVADQSFRWTDLEDNFYALDEESQIWRVLREAREALGHPFPSSNKN